MLDGAERKVESDTGFRGREKESETGLREREKESEQDSGKRERPEHVLDGARPREVDTRLREIRPLPVDPGESLMMSGLDVSGEVHTNLPWEAFGGHVPFGGSEMYWFDQSLPIHIFQRIHASGTLEMPPLDADASQWASSEAGLSGGPVVQARR